MVGNRGPYDLCTGKRIPENKGVLNTAHMGPGRYEIKSFTNEFNGKLSCTYNREMYSFTFYSVHVKFKLHVCACIMYNLS